MLGVRGNVRCEGGGFAPSSDPIITDLCPHPHQ